MAIPRQTRRQTLIKSGMIAIPTCIACILTIFVFMYANTQEQSRIRLTFAKQAETWTHAFERNIYRHIDVLYGIERFYAGSDRVDRDEFRIFVDGAFSRLVGIQALEWIPRIPHAQRVAYETLARQEGNSTFTFTERHQQGAMVPATDRPEYFPVYYVEPLRSNKAAVGFDLASNPTRLAALHQARDTGEAVATARITLVQEQESQFGFLIFVPMYKHGHRPDTLTARRQELSGFALGVFRIGDIIQTTLPLKELQDVVFWVEDVTAPADQRQLYQSSQLPSEEATGTLQNPTETNASFNWHAILNVAGRPWKLNFSPTDAYLAAKQTWVPKSILTVGLVFSALVGSLLFVVTSRATTIERLVTERTVELERSNTDLTRSNTDLEEFAYIASHDLKEPLRGIHNYATFLSEDYADQLDNDGQATLVTLIRLTKRMEELIDSLLYYSRVGRVDLARQEADLDKILDGVLDTLYIRLQEEHIEVRRPTPLPTLTCDTSRVGEIFRNLITNAIKYNDKSQKWIEIGISHGSIQEIETDRDNFPPNPWVFYVQDNGIGIPEKHQEKIFRIFKRLHNRDQYGGGTGIGLTIVKKIVERHHGQLWLESTAGDGTTFYFTLQEKA